MEQEFVKSLKPAKKFSFVPEILGIIVTAIMVLTFGAKITSEIISGFY